MGINPIITKPVEAELNQFKTLFNSAIPKDNALFNNVITYIRKKNGKLMRPILTLLTARLFGNITTYVYNSAIALELLHTASLLHDDVVDESLERHGQPSVNACFNNKTAVLCGDLILATSLVYASKTNNPQIVNLISALGQELANGELLQLQNINTTDFSQTSYFEIIRKKTAALFVTCTQAALYSIGVTQKKLLDSAGMFGEYVGICFQIRDDIFDYFDHPLTGKSAHNDMKEGKLTLPALYVLGREISQHARQVAIKIKNNSATNEEIIWLSEFVKQNGGIEYAQSVMNGYKNKAIEVLESLATPDNTDVSQSLRAYLDYVTNREK